MTRVGVHIAAVGLFSPGFGSWAEGRGVLTGDTAYRDHGLPPLERVDLPANEARRVTLSVRLALQLAHEALDRAPISIRRLAAVFACSGGNTQALAKILASLAEGIVSPNQFAHVGHNAGAGYWSIAFAQATAAPPPTASIGAFDGSFAAGLIDAAAQATIEARPVLLVATDTPPPQALAASRAIAGVFGVSLLLSPSASAMPRIALETATLEPPEAEDRLADPTLEALRVGNPAARSLPLVRLLAHGQAGRIVLPYLARRALVVHHAPW